MNSDNSSVTQQKIEEWLIDRMVHQLHIDPAEVNLDESLVAHGVDSMQFVVLVGELEEFLGVQFLSNPLVDHPTPRKLAAYLAQEIQAGNTKIGSAGS